MVRFRIDFKGRAHRNLPLTVQAFISVLAVTKQAGSDRQELSWYCQLRLSKMWSFPDIQG